LIKEEYPISLQQDTIFTISNLENFIFNNENGSTLTNIGFPPSFPVISNYVIKPLKFNKKLQGILLLANSSHQYNQDICDAIKPLTTTVETIFAGFRVMKNENFISTIFNEIIVTSFTLRGKQFFENMTNSITTKLLIDSCCLFKKVGNNFQLVTSNLRGNAKTFQVSQIMNDYLLQLSNSTKFPERNNIPNSLLQDSFVLSCGFEYIISTNVVNEKGETIGNICLFNRKVIQYTEAI
jgi:hypothetical protein